jgi:hypothetical protein
LATVQEIWQAFVDESGWPKPSPVARQQVNDWLVNPSLELRGLLFHFLIEGRDRYKVDPPFTSKELFPFVTRYFDDCLALEEGVTTDSRWILSSVDLSHGIAYWALAYWKEHRDSDRERANLTSWLRSALLKFPRYQTLLATAITDHFFRIDKRIRKQFASWRADQQLAILFPELSDISD